MANGCTSPASSPLTITVSNGGRCESLASGAWESTSTWSCGRVPLVCDEVVIQSSHIVTLDTEGTAKTIQLHDPSLLHFLNGGKLKIGGQ
ncbi:hypothetical protein [Telluribacter sp.]|uniref:hypothetical protein n=1 Tax=Telluribacter sp. TaxID=1978767 RepID=UPI002E0F571B|nr:hypothetical protein [Telluribacter sp.]